MFLLVGGTISGLIISFTCVICLETRGIVETDETELQEIVIDFSSCMITVDNKEEECIICLEEQDNDTVMIRCTHTFHKKCITEWFNEKPICPSCRTSVI